MSSQSAGMSGRIFALNEDCLTLLLKFLKLQDLVSFDVCASGDKAQCVPGSSYLNSLQHLENANLMDRQESPYERNNGHRPGGHNKWSMQSVVWGGRKNLRCLLSAGSLMVGESSDTAKEEEKGGDEEKKMKQDRLCARMDRALGVIGSKCVTAKRVQMTGPAITDRGVAALLAADVLFDDISFNCCHGITDAALAAIGEHLGESLVELSITDCPVSDVGLVQVITGCPKIVTLSLIFPTFIHNDHEKLRRFPAPAYHITPATLFAIAQSLLDLESLSCDCWGFYRLDRFDFMPNDALLAIIEACDLWYLTIERVAVNDAFLVALGDNCPNLSWFSFDGDGEHWVTDLGITALAKGCPKLTNLNVRDAREVTDAGLTALCKHCLNLERVTVPSTISDAGLEIVLKSCRFLETLSMLGCSALTVASARTLANHGGKLYLTDLEMHSIHWLDDASLLIIAAACTSLDSLTILSFNADQPLQVTNEGLLAVARACQTLTCVLLEGTLVTQDGVDELKRALPAVRCSFL